MFIHSDGKGDEGAKENLLRQFFQYFVDKWKLKAVVTLCDKNWSEINALRAVFPEAKLQLCYWHVLRAIKERMKILKRQPGPYHVEDAIAEFPWIDPTFMPIKQLSPQQVNHLPLPVQGSH
jgi:hypothetical protein